MKTGSMEIQVDFMAGTSINYAIEQSLDMLKILPMLTYVKFKFNGLQVCVNRKSSTENLTERLTKAYDNKHKHWIV